MAGLMNCPDCHGQGKIKEICRNCHGGGLDPCSPCNGTGERYDPYGGRHMEGARVPCDNCHGSGFNGPCGCENGREAVPCKLCAATGYLDADTVARIVKERQEAARLKAEQEAAATRKREADAKKAAEEQERKRKAAERDRAEKAAKIAAQEKDQALRKSLGWCIACGKPLGMMDKLARRDYHTACANSTYKPS